MKKQAHRVSASNPGLKQAVKVAGGARALARKLGISPAAIPQWDEIPTKRILEIERLTGVPRELLRPDLYRHPSLIARNHPLVANDTVAVALDGVALLVLGLHHGIPLESFRDELPGDTALGAIINRVLEASKQTNSHA